MEKRERRFYRRGRRGGGAEENPTQRFRGKGK